jgi:ribosomal protein S18 acetylase RimI-like enzyme
MVNVWRDLSPMPDIRVRVFRSSEWRSYRDLRLRALQDSPTAFSTTFADASARSDEDWASRMAEGSAETDLPLVAEVDGELAGMAWGKIYPSERATAHLYQMWVAPEHRGLGVGRMLLEKAIEWARSHGVRWIILGVTCGDTPARRLYTSAGFQAIGDPEPLRPGSELGVQWMRLEISPGSLSRLSPVVGEGEPPE